MIIIGNTHNGSKPPSPPIKKDGTLYAYRCYFDEMARIAFADTIEEIISLFIPNYIELNDYERADARITRLSSLRTSLAAQIVANLSPDDATEEEFSILSSATPGGWSKDGVDIWDSPVPLVLLAQEYVPYTDVDRPISAHGDTVIVDNIITLDALDDEEFIKSLTRAGAAYFSRLF